jgi:hypothetical protein
MKKLAVFLVALLVAASLYNLSSADAQQSSNPGRECYVPLGGTTGQVLSKSGNAYCALQWSNGGGSLTITTTNTIGTAYPTFATGTGSQSTLYIDPTSPLSYNNGLLTALNLTVSGNASLNGTTTISNLQLTSTSAPCAGCAGTSTVYPESYGAVGNGKFKFDGVYTSTAPNATLSNTSSTTATAPSVTTITNNDLVVDVFQYGAAWTTTPTTTGATVEVNTGIVANSYNFYALDYTQTTAGATPALSGVTTTASSSLVWSYALAPTSTTSPTFIAATTTNIPATSFYGPLVLTKPTGTTNGDYLIACYSLYNNNYNEFHPLMAPPSTSWTWINGAQPTGTANAGQYRNCYGHAVGASEPSTYSFPTYSSFDLSAFIVDYRGTSGIDNPTSTLTSATAAFTATVSGDPICVAGIVSPTGAIAGGGQRCGTITAYNSATSVNTSFSVVNSASGLQFDFGASDQTAFQNMLTTAPCSTAGCKIQLQNKDYILTGSLYHPQNIPIIWFGAGAGVPNNAQNFTILSKNNTDNGSKLLWLTQAMTAGALNFTGTAGTSFSVGASDAMQDLTVYGGAGYGFDGGGADGIDMKNWDNLSLTRVDIFNFTGYGAVFNSLGSSSPNYINFENWIANDIEYNGSGGIQIGGSGIGFVEAPVLQGNLIEANGGPAITLGSGIIQGFNLTNGNIIQWNNVNPGTAGSQASPPEILFSGGVLIGSENTGNYYEIDDNAGSQSGALKGSATSQTTTGDAFTHTGSNFYLGTYTPSIYSAAGVALPSCIANGKWNTAKVSDATSCVNGATYASGGSDTCYVTCNGTSWIVSYGEGPVSGDPLTAKYLALSGTSTNTTVVNGIYLSAANTLKLTTSGANALTVSTTGNVAFTNPISTGGYTVSGLPTGIIGMRAYVTDQTTSCPLAGGTLTGSGGVTCPVFYNGSAWVGD